jgi:hypothetical protein
MVASRGRLVFLSLAERDTVFALLYAVKGLLINLVGLVLVKHPCVAFSV